MSAARSNPRSRNVTPNRASSEVRESEAWEVEAGSAVTSTTPEPFPSDTPRRAYDVDAVRHESPANGLTLGRVSRVCES